MSQHGSDRPPRTHGLINRSAVRAFLLEYAQRHRAHVFNRVTPDVYAQVEAAVREQCRRLVHAQPSAGKTIKQEDHMGADQIGYLVKGPTRIPAGRLKAAVRACKRLRQELMRDAGAGTDVDPRDIPEDPEAAIREFVEWWRVLDCRDTCSRPDPDDPRQKIVYAGEMSWGDEPDGYGYRMLKRAFTWGFAEALGIR